MYPDCPLYCLLHFSRHPLQSDDFALEAFYLHGFSCPIACSSNVKSTCTHVKQWSRDRLCDHICRTLQVLISSLQLHVASAFTLLIHINFFFDRGFNILICDFNDFLQSWASSKRLTSVSNVFLKYIILRSWNTLALLLFKQHFWLINLYEYGNCSRIARKRFICIEAEAENFSAKCTLIVHTVSLECAGNIQST